MCEEELCQTLCGNLEKIMLPLEFHQKQGSMCASSLLFSFWLPWIYPATGILSHN